MPVSASFEPGRISSEPGGTAALTLRLHNDAETDEVVKLRVAGELAPQTVLQSDTIYLDPNETFELPVIIDVGQTLTAGPHSSTIEVSNGEGSASVAEATIDVEESMGYGISLLPERSRSSAAGRHRVAVRNTGNTPVLVEMRAQSVDSFETVETEEGTEVVEVLDTEIEPKATIDLASPAVNVYPGDEAKVEIRVVPAERFWNGAIRPHLFVVDVLASDGTSHRLNGTFDQGPRLRPWVVPALVGAGLAMLLFTIAWFTLLRPAVEDIATEKAVEAILADRAALQDRIDALQRAAAEAEELPLGEPADLRLSASAAPGGSASESFAVSAGRILSVTDVVFQNPTGAVGTMSLRRNGEILLESEMANFRDLDFHFVAPLQFEGGSTIEMRIDCTEPGPNQAECSGAATIIGFVDEQP
ncbi:MAG: COG1470 family protein [Ilumatobacteraceae bacterium]